MCGGAPKPPAPMDPGQVASTQQGYNQQALEQGQAASQVNQFNPFGSQTWTQSGTGPGGIPTYTMSQNLSPAEQALLQQYQGFQGAAGGAGENLMNAAAGMYGAGVPNLIGGADSMTNQMMGHELGYLSPFFGQQTDQLNTQLANQGLTPGTPAYDNAMRTLRTNQGQTVSGFLAQAEPQAFQQSVQQYELPMEMAGRLAQMGGPAGLNFSQMPQWNMQPANYTGAVSQAENMQMQQYQAQLQQQNAMMQGLGGLGQAGIMGMAMGALPFI